MSILTLLVLASDVRASPPACGSAACQAKKDRQVIAFFLHRPRLAKTPAAQRVLWAIVARLDARLRSLQAERARPRVSDHPLYKPFICIHEHEGAWNANTGNGYYGGLQMDWGFMRSYGSEYLSRWGSADKWPPAVQIEVAIRAYESGRGFGPWPNTRRMCGV